MFNIPVISSSSRYSSESCGMMHLNALNGSLSSSHDSLGSGVGGLPSYEEAVSNGPLFGLFNVNGGDSTHHHHHHHHGQHHHHHSYNHHHHYHSNSSGSSNNNIHIQFPQSYHSPQDHTNGNYPPPTYSDLLQPPLATGSDVTVERRSPSPVSRPGGRSRDDKLGGRSDVDRECERLSLVSLDKSPPRSSCSFLPKSPRLQKRSVVNTLAVPSTTSTKTGSGNGRWRKQLGGEKSAMSTAKDRLYRVFSPMLPRKQDRQARSASKDRSGRKSPMPTAQASSQEEEMTSLPMRHLGVTSGRHKSNRASDAFDDISGHGGQGKTKHHQTRKLRGK